MLNMIDFIADLISQESFNKGKICKFDLLVRFVNRPTIHEVSRIALYHMPAFNLLFSTNYLYTYVLPVFYVAAFMDDSFLLLIHK